MKTIAICNLKGGVGKTVTTANVGHILATSYGKNVLLIDGDSQGNLSQYFSVTPEEGSTTVDLLEIGTNCYPDFVTGTKIPGIDIIPADMTLMDADVDAIKDGRCKLQSIADLRDAIEEDNALEHSYDYILIDCPPAFSAASTAALMAADEVIIPIRLDAFSTEGMTQLTAQIRNMHRINERTTLGGLLVTQYTRTPEEQDSLAWLRDQSGLPVYERIIRYSKRVSASTFARQPLAEFSPGSAAARDYKRFVDELIAAESRGERNG